jgi:hypothetical protein
MKANPTRTGATFAVVVAVAYAACALLFWLWPQAATSFMNALFHGLDFGRLQSGGGTFSFGGFAYALAGITFWAFVLGTLFAWLQQRAQAPS